MPYAFGPVVVIVPSLVKVLPLPLAAMPSLSVPVVPIGGLRRIGDDWLSFPVPSIPAPRFPPLPPPPVSDIVPRS